jgi:hypothetical protein
LKKKENLIDYGMVSIINKLIVVINQSVGEVQTDSLKKQTFEDRLRLYHLKEVSNLLISYLEKITRPDPEAVKTIRKLMKKKRKKKVVYYEICDSCELLEKGECYENKPPRGKINEL